MTQGVKGDHRRKPCRACGGEKPSGRSRQLCDPCKEQAPAYHRTPKGKQQQEDYRLQRAYGVSLEEYYLLLRQQGGVCAVCEKVNKNGNKLSVDHDHVTGVVRGLLCYNCNRGIGWLGDSPPILLRALEYVRGY